MKRKIFVFVCTLLMTLTAIVIPSDINVEASGGDSYPDPGLNHTYIYQKLNNLSKLVFDSDYEWRSREFGEAGERKAAEYIEKWMKDLNLTNVHKEPIDVYWNSFVYPNWQGGDGWNLDVLNKKRQFGKDDYYLKINVKNRITQQTVEDDILDDIVCFPFLKGNKFGDHNVIKDNVKVVKSFNWLDIREQIIILNAFWAPNPFTWWGSLSLKRFKDSRAVGFILVDDDDANPHTRFMHQSHRDWHDKYYDKWAYYIKAGFSVNHTVGDRIRYYLNRPGRYKVTADIKSVWEYEEDVESYNVIGQINGTDTDNVSIVGAHYDSWWIQGTIDEGAETVLCLGIAKYMKDKNLTLKHTVKFIAFGAEEMSKRGAKDYVEDHPDENIIYMINPGNFGHEDRYWKIGPVKFFLPFETPSNDKKLNWLAENVTYFLKFTDRTGIKVECDTSDLGAEDSMIFAYTDSCDSVIQFSRWPYKGYHRDGLNHKVGDIMDILDNESFQIECEVVASVALHLTVDSEHRFVNTSVKSYDKSGDGNNDSVKAWFNITTDTNTSLLGKVRGYLTNLKSGSFIKMTAAESDIYMLEKNKTIAGSINLCLPYNKPCGNYSVRLTVVDYWDDVDESYNETVYFHPYSKPVADYNVFKTSLKTRTFKDNSTPSPDATIVSWNWSFGDGNYSNQQNTSHTYYFNGNYTISLTVWDSNNLSNTSNITIAVDNAVPSVSISVASNVQIAGESISFNTSAADSDGSITNYTWDFGDNSTDNSAGPSHTYSKSGLYTVNLTVTDNDAGTNYTTKTMIIAGALADDSYQQDNPQNHTWDTVQEAINDVKDEDIVYVYNGNYPESITINRSISLYGQDKEQVIIQSLGTILDIVNESVNINGFTMKNGNTAVQINQVNNCSIVNCNINDSLNGIKITSEAENNTISRCNFSGNSYGVFISGSYNWIGSQSSDLLCNDSYFALNRYGVYIDNSHDNMIVGCSIDARPSYPPITSYGVCLDEAVNNTIICSKMHQAGNNGYGVYMDDSSGNIICHNLIEFNDNGVFLTGSSDNRIAMNNISNNAVSGLTIIMMSSSGNSIHWNDFTRNGLGLYPQAFDDGSCNLWNTSGNETLQYVSAGEGNYWSDYNGSDSDGNGIGDISYSIPGIANAVDNYPVMKANDYKYS